MTNSSKPVVPSMRSWGSTLLATLVWMLITFSAAAFAKPSAPPALPEGLSGSDWQSIQAAWQASRHAIAEAPDQPGTYSARNPGQQWTTQFDGRGFDTRPDGAAWSWGLELQRWGVAGSERSISGKTPLVPDGQRASYHWGSELQEWFVNDTRGLEHGYTVHSRPAGTGDQLRFELAVRGGLSPQIDSGGRDVRFVDDSGSTALTYSGLKVWDADGKMLQAAFEPIALGLALAVDTRDARYPITIDPVAQQAYLKASNTDAGDLFGIAVGISGDTVVVGAIFEASNSTTINSGQGNNSAGQAGAAYVFVRNGTSWTQQAYLKASNAEAGDQFGASVAISGDTIVVGAVGENSNSTTINAGQGDNSANDAGAAYVFVRSGTTWTQQAYLKASNAGTLDAFGWSVAIDGDTVLVGANSEDSNSTTINSGQSDNSAPNAGAAYVFSRSGSTWSQQAYLKAFNAELGDTFGQSVAVSGDTAVVGANNEDSNSATINSGQGNNAAPSAGAAYVFVRSGGVWSQQAYLKAFNTDPLDVFGTAVDVWGNTVVVGATGEASTSTTINSGQGNNGAANAGAAYVFVRSGVNWTQQAYLKAPNTDAGDNFGISTAIDGDMLVIGAYFEASNSTAIDSGQSNNSATNAGAAYLYSRSGSSWSPVSYLKPSNTDAGDLFGVSAAISGDSIVIGSYLEASNSTTINSGQANNAAGQAGAAYVFTAPLDCTGFSFPYTLAGADNTARVANLRQAIACANSNATADVIDLNGQVLTFSDSVTNFSGLTALPQISTDITLQNGSLTRTGAAAFRFLSVPASGILTLNRMTLSNGSNSIGSGAVYSSGRLTVRDSTLAGNVGDSAGALLVDGGGANALLVVNSTFSGNSATNASGADAIHLFGVNQGRVYFSTFSGHDNSSTSSTLGVLHAGNNSALELVGSVIANNPQTGGGTARECTAGLGASFTGGANLSADNLCPGHIGTPTNVSVTLASNGGPTQTHLLNAGSNAIDGDGINACGTVGVSTDQRGLARPIGPRCDLGAVEIVALPSVSIAVTPAGVSEDGATNLVYTVTRSLNLPASTLVNITTTGTATAGTDYTGGVANVTIPANATTATITIDPAVDGIVEANETVILAVAPGSGYSVGTPASATGTIINDDLPAASISVSPASVAEDGAGNLIYTVTLNQAAFSPTSVNFTVAGTAAAGIDYAAVTSPLLIPTGMTTGTITINPTADGIVEPDETVILTVASGSGYSVGAPASATGTILNDDSPNLAIDDVSASEGNSGTSTITFTVSLSSPAGPGGVSFNIASANGTAIAGSDYIAQSLVGQTIPAGMSSYVFSILVTGDTLFEGTETFFVNVSNVLGATVLDGQGLGTIFNDDAAPSLSIDNVSVTEGNSGTTFAQFTVSLSAASGLTASVNYATANGTAVAPGDYTSTADLFTLNPGETSATVTVPVLGDTTPEPDESFSVTLSAPTNATIAPGGGTGTGTILNDDVPEASISVLPASVAEDGAANLVYSVSLSAPAISATTVNLSVAGTATSGSDYSGALSSVLIPMGDSSATVTIDPIADSAIESDETVIISVLAGSGYSVGAASVAAGTISNDDFPTATIAVSPGSVTEDGASNLVYSVSLDQPAPFAVVLNLSTSGTATSGSDYSGAVSTVTLPAFDTTATITIDPSADAMVEPNETVIISIAAGSGYSVGTPASATGTISNDDTAGVVVTPSGGSTDVTEGGATDDYTLVLTSQPSGNVVISLGTAGQLSASPAPITFTSANWDSAQTVTVTAIDDLIAEGPHMGTISHIATSGDGNYNGITVASVVANITDNDVPGVSVVESGGSTALTEGGATDTFTVVLTSQPTATVNIALNGTQVTAAPTSLSFTTANWDIVQTVTLTAIDDAIAEGTHSGSLGFVLTSADPNYDALAVAAVSATITDNDSAGINVTPTSGLVTTEAGGSATFTVALGSEPVADVSIGLSSSDPTEGTVSETSLTFTAANWDTPQTVTITGVDDAVDDGDIAYSIVTAAAVSADPNYGGVDPPDVGVSNTDDDMRGIAVLQSGGNTAVTEGGAGDSFTVVLTSEPEASVQIALDGGTQVMPAPTSLSFGPANWDTPQTVMLSAIDDALFENDPHPGSVGFTVTSADAGYNAFVLTAVSVSITDNDPAPLISVSSPSQPEGNAGTSVMNFVVSLSAVSTLPVSFSYATADGTATVANNDYVALAPTAASIAAGQQTLTIPVTINGDTVFEGDESFSLELAGIINATPSPTVSGTGTIEEDDQQPTTTTISSDLPDPSVVGQPYTVAVDVAGSSSSPLGTIMISDGTDSCGPVTLVAGTSPNSSVSCDLTSTSAGSKTLTASYTPASTAFAASDGTAMHQVNPASTTISVTGPIRSRINQPTAFSVVLAVTAPGGGSPTGTVTLSSGASSCVVTLPATSCNLSFDALGSRTISASYAGNADYNGSSSSGAGDAQTLVYALADIVVSKTDGINTYAPGELIVYTVQLRNLGPDDAFNLRLRDILPAELANALWSCDSSGGTTCPQNSGSGDLDELVASFPVGALLNYSLYANVQGSPPELVNTALVELPADTTIEDPTTGNNSATDIDLLDLLFDDSFEDAAINAPSGHYQLPSLALRSVLDDIARAVFVLDDADGEALRVYARIWEGQVQYALALRDQSGALRLGAWSGYSDEPTLRWSARNVDGGWVIESAELR